MRKKIIDIIYFVLLLTTIFSSSYTMLYDMASKDGFSVVDTDIELLDDSNMTDTGEISTVEIDDNTTNDMYAFFFSNLSVEKKHFLYLQNTSEIYLGLHLPPPKSL